jgi:hypothetical protein
MKVKNILLKHTGKSNAKEQALYLSCARQSACSVPETLLGQNWSQFGKIVTNNLEEI